jgi:GNAT superfamily N-acetyltransferase
VILAVNAADWAQDVVRVHEAAASVAYAHIFSEPFPRGEVLARWAAHEGKTVLAVRDEVVVGFAASSPDGTLEGLYVLPDEAGRGVGTALLDAVTPVARLWVLENNVAGRSFYERRGWCWSGVRQAAPDAGGVPELLYVR